MRVAADRDQAGSELAAIMRRLSPEGAAELLRRARELLGREVARGGR